MFFEKIGSNRKRTYQNRKGDIVTVEDYIQIKKGSKLYGFTCKTYDRKTSQYYQEVKRDYWVNSITKKGIKK